MTLILGSSGVGNTAADALGRPPDPAVACNSTTVLVATNWCISLYDKNMQKLAFTNTRPFYGANGEAFDQCVYQYGDKYWIFGLTPYGLSIGRAKIANLVNLDPANWTFLHLSEFSLSKGGDRPQAAVTEQGLLLN